jgi:hypothetical protein
MNKKARLHVVKEESSNHEIWDEVTFLRQWCDDLRSDKAFLYKLLDFKDWQLSNYIDDFNSKSKDADLVIVHNKLQNN